MPLSTIAGARGWARTFGGTSANLGAGMADLSGFEVESKHGKGRRMFFPDAQNFHPKTKAIFAQFGRCESCGGVLSVDTLRCVEHGHDEGIWISEDDAIEQIELALGEEKRRNKNHRRKERRSEAMEQLPGFHRSTDLRAIWQAQSGRCYYCAANLNGIKVRRDHLEPLDARRSSNWPSNIVLTCFPCNRDKSDMSPGAYWRLLERKRGAVWVKSQKARNMAVTELARQLTKQRKQELTQICSQVAERLRRGIDELIANDQLTLPVLEYPRVEYDDSGMMISYMGVDLRFPPNSHWRVSRNGWVARETPKLLDAILSIEAAFEGITYYRQAVCVPPNSGLQGAAPRAARA